MVNKNKDVRRKMVIRESFIPWVIIFGRERVAARIDCKKIL